MSRILICGCKQEVSTFNPVRSGYADFITFRGEEILRYDRGRRSEIGGALSVFDAHPGVEAVPGFVARSIVSAGTLSAEGLRRISEEFLSAVRSAGPVDGVFFAMHGAMAAEGEEDPEGYLLQETRKILGEEVPIVVSLDLHGILTDRMVEHSDALVMYHTYPHVDFFETGERAGKVLMKILQGHARPVSAKVAIPALVRGRELITDTGIFGNCIRDGQAIERSPGGLVAGMFIGNPFTDVPELQTYSIVTTDGDAGRAEQEAIRIANLFWPHREKMRVPLTSIEESVAIAARTPGTVALVDAADATSSGASGDGNSILAELIRSGYRKRALIPVVDPPAVKAAWAAGVGGTVKTTVGGAMDPKRFKPLPIEGKVRMLSDGRFPSESFGDIWYSGNTAVIEVGTITLVVTSRAVSLYDRALFHAHGQDPKRFDSVVVKSPYCEHKMFEAWCSRMVDVDAPGSTSADVRSLGHTRCPRPIFPLDADVPFIPKAKLFQRARYKRRP